ncbi:hypothetical protein PCH_Pc14g02310 [Penicillium rubens Wisconsin 54-1255]|uniref:Uncharacterized protein n=1 Tax=Penicillium rubens (strain ATCC 28089 / DSM 1075 / NRRL 1951 / Wisconsin 54-1255) TaxID=500485 RepID=B6H656_PENRW|nr:hypothetical protein PCH_Pc14g02310 [Penicillium rubens Wisconsin 54-1255]
MCAVGRDRRKISHLGARRHVQIRSYYPRPAARGTVYLVIEPSYDVYVTLHIFVKLPLHSTQSACIWWKSNTSNFTGQFLSGASANRRSRADVVAKELLPERAIDLQGIGICSSCQPYAQQPYHSELYSSILFNLSIQAIPALQGRLERSLNWTGDGSEGGMNVASVCVKAAAGYQIYLRAYYYGVYRAYRLEEGNFAERGAYIRAISGSCGEDASGRYKEVTLRNPRAPSHRKQPHLGGIERDLNAGLNEVLLSVDFRTLLTERRPEMLKGTHLIDGLPEIWGPDA